MTELLEQTVPAGATLLTKAAQPEEELAADATIARLQPNSQDTWAVSDASSIDRVSTPGGPSSADAETRNGILGTLRRACSHWERQWGS